MLYPIKDVPINIWWALYMPPVWWYRIMGIKWCKQYGYCHMGVAYKDCSYEHFNKPQKEADENG